MPRIGFITSENCRDRYLKDQPLVSAMESKGWESFWVDWQALDRSPEADLYLIHSPWDYTEYLTSFLKSLKPLGKSLYSRTLERLRQV